MRIYEVHKANLDSKYIVVEGDHIPPLSLKLLVGSSKVTIINKEGWKYYYDEQAEYKGKPNNYYCKGFHGTVVREKIFKGGKKKELTPSHLEESYI